MKIPGYLVFPAMTLLLSAGCAGTHMRRGDRMAAERNYQRAASAYTRSLDVVPSYDAHLKRGIVLGELGEHDLALQDFSEAALLRPGDNRQALLYQGEHYLKQGNLEKALEVSDELAAENPRDVMAVSLRGEVWFAKGDYRQALEDFEAALRTAGPADPLRLDLLYNRAISLYKLGRFRDARLAYQDYIEGRTSRGKGLRQQDHYNMGLFCYADYDYEAARVHWMRLSARQRQAIAARVREESLRDIALQ